jgi:hypothetical protein
MSKSSKGETELLIKIYEMAMSAENKKAAMWWMNEPKMTYEQFKSKYPPGSEGYTNFITVGGFFELIGVLVYYRLIHKEAIFDLIGLQWEKSEPIVKGMQKEQGRDLFENYEWMAKEKAKWFKTRPPKFPEDK